MREFGSEHPAILLPDGYFDSFESFGHCTWLRSGREALQLVGLNVKPSHGQPILLMPAYSCHSMVDPFVRIGWRIAYYPLCRDLTADLDALARLMVNLHPTAILTMNYYGATPTNKTVAFVKSHDPRCVCIEDFSHCSFSLDTIYNPDIEFYVSSIRKSVGICDGAVVVSKVPMDESFVLEDETDFVVVRREEQFRKARYQYSRDQALKQVFLPNLRQQEINLDNYVGIHRISRTGKAQLAIINGREVRYARQVNMAHILDLLDGKVQSIPGIKKCIEGAPFSFPVLVDGRDEAQYRLGKAGVYAPVLWPISEEARSVCPISSEMADRMLSIPIDQRFNYEDIEEIARIVLTYCS